jgi:hypothetical protein
MVQPEVAKASQKRRLNSALLVFVCGALTIESVGQRGTDCGNDGQDGQF